MICKNCGKEEQGGADVRFCSECGTCFVIPHVEQAPQVVQAPVIERPAEISVVEPVVTPVPLPAEIEPVPMPTVTPLPTAPPVQPVFNNTVQATSPQHKSCSCNVVPTCHIVPPPYKPQYLHPINNMAILGLVFAFFTPTIGLILSCVGLSHSKRADMHGSGRGLAIAGLVISIITLVLVILIVAFAIVVTVMYETGRWSFSS